MKDLLLCGSCGEPFILGDNLTGEICSICHKECHWTCKRYASYYDNPYPSYPWAYLPGMKEALIDNNIVCLSCISNLELQIINTLPLKDLPKLINYRFEKEEGRLRLLERMSDISPF
jgi:hypothetical protein